MLQEAAHGLPTARITGADGFAVAVSEHRFGVSSRHQPVDVVFLAPEDAAAVRASAMVLDDGPVLPVPDACGDVGDDVLAEVRRLRPYRVVVLGGAGQVCDAQVAQAVDAATVTPQIDAATRVLSADERAAISEVGDATVAFADAPASLDDVAVGSILVSEPAPEAPDGLLRR